MAIPFRNDLEASPLARILWVDREIEGQGWEIFKTHQDKEYSFTDCTSFALMQAHVIKNAFTFDRHFQQHGFSMLP